MLAFSRPADTEAGLVRRVAAARRCRRAHQGSRLERCATNAAWRPSGSVQNASACFTVLRRLERVHAPVRPRVPRPPGPPCCGRSPDAARCCSASASVSASARGCPTCSYRGFGESSGGGGGCCSGSCLRVCLTPIASYASLPPRPAGSGVDGERARTASAICDSGCCRSRPAGDGSEDVRPVGSIVAVGPRPGPNRRGQPRHPAATGGRVGVPRERVPDGVGGWHAVYRRR